MLTVPTSNHLVSCIYQIYAAVDALQLLSSPTVHTELAVPLFPPWHMATLSVPCSPSIYDYSQSKL